MARMGQEVLARGDDHLVTRHDDGHLAVLAWHPVDGSPTTPSDGHPVRLSVPLGPARAGVPDGGARSAFALRRRVNEADGNAWSAWRGLGRPASPTSAQLDLLHDAARPAVEHRVLEVTGGGADGAGPRAGLDLALARHEVTCVEVWPVRDETPPWLDYTRIPGYADGRAR